MLKRTGVITEVKTRHLASAIAKGESVNLGFYQQGMKDQKKNVVSSISTLFHRNVGGLFYYLQVYV